MHEYKGRSTNIELFALPSPLNLCTNTICTVQRGGLVISKITIFDMNFKKILTKMSFLLPLLLSGTSEHVER